MVLHSNQMNETDVMSPGVKLLGNATEEESYSLK